MKVAYYSFDELEQSNSFEKYSKNFSFLYFTVCLSLHSTTLMSGLLILSTNSNVWRNVDTGTWSLINDNNGLGNALYSCIKIPTRKCEDPLKVSHKNAWISDRDLK